MNWQSIITRTVSRQADLSGPLEELLQGQREMWELFRAGEQALAKIKTKVFHEGGSRVIVQANPGRRKSTLAKVDAESISGRRCFLCPESISPEERGIAFGDLVILPNPYPVLPRHLTIPGREHVPQSLSGRVPAMLELARAMGAGMVVFYNGPLCGASAPDHFHFQACSSLGFPLLEELPQEGRQSIRSFGRSLLFCASDGPGEIVDFVETVLRLLPHRDPEPPFNVLAIYGNGLFRTVICPRAKHRPECFFAKDESRLAISPAAMEMAGVMVVAESEHFERVDESTVRSIYQEVSLPAADFGKLVEAVT